MERLTYDFCFNGVHCNQVKGADNLQCSEVCEREGSCKECPIARAFDRLAAIDDILGDDYDLDHLRELIQADREGHRPAPPIGRCKDCDCYWPNAEQCGRSGETVKENDFCSKFKPKEAPNG